MWSEAAEAALQTLVEANRTRCLWFLRPDFVPASDAARLRVLDAIEQHGDRDAAREAATLRQCLSRPSNENSAAS